MIENRKEFEELELREKTEELSRLNNEESARQMENILLLYEEIPPSLTRPDPMSLRLLISQVHSLTT